MFKAQYNNLYFQALMLSIFMALFVMSCASFASNWNSPYTNNQVKQQKLFNSFSSPPKHLDPVVSYNSNEWAILSQVYEPLLQYHYLKRPYKIEPLTLTRMPVIRHLDKHNQAVSDSSNNIEFTEYLFELKRDIGFQNHPAFVLNDDNSYLYHELAASQLDRISNVNDFAKQSSRELLAADYVYAIKRMGLRQNNSPVLDSMQAYIVGLKEFSKQVTQAFDEQLKQEGTQSKVSYFDLNQYEISGVQVIDSHRFKIKIKGVYPQFLYWLTMNFFAPIPWEADKFYKQPGLVEKNITLDTSPVGTGAYYLAENNPNRQMRLIANPNYHQAFYPSSGLADGADRALLDDAGKQLPFIKEVVYTLEKESVPLWNKFLQGYYDASGVSSDSFDQAVSVSGSGNMSLTNEMQERGIQFVSQIQPTIFYFGFNMADPVVGGYSVKQQKLRQAISIAVNFEEYISIFLNGRGMSAQGPIPPGIFGHEPGEKGVNSVVYDWKVNRLERKSIEYAKKLLAEAGYPNGRKDNGEPLSLYYDTAATGPDSQSELNWYRKQFAKLGINLIIRATDYNRFQDKIRNAKGQMFSWGWNADYPDPENFLFLLYGGNATINTDGSGVNSANYDNPEFNRLFKLMKTMANGPERLKIIQKMVSIAQQDAPWIWGFHPKSLALYHSWLKNVWPNALANNTTKYRRIDAAERFEKQQAWNSPVVWPLILVLLVSIIAIWPLKKAYLQRQKSVISSNQNKSTKEGV
ncbi:ABC transporter substrate-binding protein [Thiomicrorhabdus lithotrophica]|uniref:ABC transporter substrate-binding protein n=1 Tax=Thiomicrorhabdus lithotrophica TaxID=2949997 RepID=A0ABY8CDY4_9GAMM|nr:ABC transporter substrate-binding protein [Thiomicrorhabdus lithotrophica]WEJ63702.1 ABC transporter substrate-binding protein [Thiomicrorhabdus lithotrophica]